MKLIQQITVGSGGAASITFSSIPADFTDLKIVFSLRSARASVADDIIYRINGNTASNYSWRFLVGTGSGRSSSVNSSATSNYLGLCSASNSTASTFGNQVLYLPNYTSSSAKSSSVDAVSENNATEAYQTIIANLWNQTAAVTSLTFFPETASNFVQHSSATLYGILKGSDGITTAT